MNSPERRCCSPTTAPDRRVTSEIISLTCTWPGVDSGEPGCVAVHIDDEHAGEPVPNVRLLDVLNKDSESFMRVNGLIEDNIHATFSLCSFVRRLDVERRVEEDGLSQHVPICFLLRIIVFVMMTSHACSIDQSWGIPWYLNHKKHKSLRKHFSRR